MALLYPQEHLSCFNYNMGEESLMVVKSYKKGDSDGETPAKNSIIFVLEGEISFSFGEYVDVLASKGEIFVHPAHLTCTFLAKEDTTLLLFRLSMDLSFCDHFSFEMLLREKAKIKDEGVYFLEINEEVYSFLHGMKKYLNDGLRCTYFLELKIKEFLYVLRAYYPKEQLKAFFYPILNHDLEFSTFVYQMYQQVNTVKELADILQYSLSGFEKRFKKVFGIPANQWMQNQKAKNIYHDINCSTKSFTKLSSEYGFSSPSHFGEFCKKNFNDTPGNIRKKYLAEK